MRKVIAILTLFILLSPFSFGQKIKYSNSFLKKLEVTNIDLFEPVEGKYRSLRPVENDYQAIDHVIISRQEDLEIRFALIPYNDKQVPNVDFMRLLSSAATNDQERVITIHQISESELTNNFNADWGSMAFFQPKKGFSDKKHCRLLGLFKEEKGLVYVFFLFDEPTRFLDQRFYTLRFN